jgi:GntR family transcriptional repressor for pyruvate dehydrogenase complex
MKRLEDEEASEAGRFLRTRLPVNRIQPAYAQVATQLRDLVVAGKLGPGDPLPSETDLAAGFGVSRSTVREALRSLAAQNLVHTTRGVTGGTFISFVDEEAVRDYLEASIGLLSRSDGVTVSELLEARASMEVPAAMWAASRRSPQHVEDLQRNVDTAISDTEGRFEKHQTFHRIVLNASGNRLLELVASPVFDVIRTRFIRDKVSATYWEEVDADHVAMSGYIADADADGAGEAMRTHLERLTATYESTDRRSRPKEASTHNRDRNVS